MNHPTITPEQWSQQWLASLPTDQLRREWEKAKRCSHNATSSRFPWRAQVWDERAEAAFKELEYRSAEAHAKGEGPGNREQFVRETAVQLMNHAARGILNLATLKAALDAAWQSGRVEYSRERLAELEVAR